MKELFRLYLLAWLTVAAWSKTLDQIYKYDKVILYTGTEFNSDRHVVQVEGKRSMSFRVRACSNVSLLLSALKGEESITTELVIGANSNTRTVFRSATSQEEFASAVTPNILHCNELRSFWVSFDFALFRVGRGPSYGGQVMLEVKTSDTPTLVVGYVALTTSDGHSGVWEIDEHEFVTLLSKPPGDGLFQYLWRTVEHAPGSYFFFTVAACKDVSIALGTEVGDTYYTIDIGYQGTYNRIKMGSEVIIQTTEATLHCDNLRTFWVNWEYDSIALGRGAIKWSDVVIEAAGFNLTNIYALGFTVGPDPDFKGIFSIAATIDEMYTFFVNNPVSELSGHDHWLYIAEGQYVSFMVQACGEVHVVLSDVMGSVTTESVTLIIGGWDNTKMALTDSNGNILVDADGTFLACDFTVTYWVSFWNGKIKVGTPAMNGYTAIISVDTSLANNITAVGFGNRHEEGAHFTLLPFESGIILLQTKENIDRFDTWVSGRRRYYLEFDVSACEQTVINFATVITAEIFMTEIDGSYHLIFGYGGNMNNVSIVYRTKAGDEILASNSKAGLLSCDGFNTYYISWYEGQIILGQGDLTGGSMLLRMKGYTKYDINAVSFHTNQTGFWRMNMEAGDQLSFQHPDESVAGEYKWVNVHHTLIQQRFWVTGTGIKIMLASVFMDTSQAYEFDITTTSITLTKNGDNLERYTGTTIAKGRRSMMVVSWVDGVIRIAGVGTDSHYIAYVDHSPLQVSAIGVDPYGESSEFRMPNSFALILGFTSSTSWSTSQVWMELSRMDMFSFTVQMSHSAEVVLAPYMYHDDLDHYYRVIIGAESNTKTLITRFGMVLASVDTPDILSADEARLFWIQFYHGEIAVGRGHHAAYDMIITWYDASPSPILAAAFTGDGETGTWMVLLTQREGAVDATAKGSGLAGGAIAGIVIGVLLGVALICGVFYVYKFGLPDAVGRHLPSTNRTANQHNMFDNPISYGDSSAIPTGTYAE